MPLDNSHDIICTVKQKTLKVDQPDSLAEGELECAWSALPAMISAMVNKVRDSFGYYDDPDEDE